MVFEEQDPQRGLGAHRVAQHRDAFGQRVLELERGAAHVPVGGDQPDRADLVLGHPVGGLARVAARVERGEAERDAAVHQPRRDVVFGGELAGCTSRSTPVTSIRRAAPSRSSFEPARDPPAAAGRHDDRVGLLARRPAAAAPPRTTGSRTPTGDQQQRRGSRRITASASARRARSAARSAWRAPRRPAGSPRAAPSRPAPSPPPATMPEPSAANCRPSSSDRRRARAPARRARRARRRSRSSAGRCARSARRCRRAGGRSRSSRGCEPSALRAASHTAAALVAASSTISPTASHCSERDRVEHRREPARLRIEPRRRAPTRVSAARSSSSRRGGDRAGQPHVDQRRHRDRVLLGHALLAEPGLEQRVELLVGHAADFGHVLAVARAAPPRLRPGASRSAGRASTICTVSPPAISARALLGEVAQREARAGGDHRQRDHDRDHPRHRPGEPRLRHEPRRRRRSAATLRRIGDGGALMAPPPRAAADSAARRWDRSAARGRAA